MIGAIGLITSLAGTAWSAYQSAKSAKSAQAIADKEHAQQQQWYNNKLAEDYTQRSDIQATLNRQRELLKESYQRARATNAVAGGTDESLQNMQNAQNESLAETTASIASNASAYKDSLEQGKMQESQRYADTSANIQQQRAKNAADAGAGLMKAGANMMSSENSWGWLKRKTK